MVESIKQGHQAMVFVHSRKDTGKTARTLIDLAANAEQLELFINNDHPKFSLMKVEYLHILFYTFAFFSQDFNFCAQIPRPFQCQSVVRTLIQFPFDPPSQVYNWWYN